MDEFKLGRDLSFYNSIVKILTFKRNYKITLSLSDMYLNLVSPNHRENDCENLRSIYSCLLYSSIETREYWRSVKFFKQVIRSGLTPSDRDYTNVTRAIIEREDWLNGFKIIATRASTGNACIPMFIKAVVQKDPSVLAQILRSITSTVVLSQVMISLSMEKNGIPDTVMDQLNRRFFSESHLIDTNTISSMTRIIDDMERFNSEFDGGFTTLSFLNIVMSHRDRIAVSSSEAVTRFLNSAMKSLIHVGNMEPIRSKIIPFFKGNLLVNPTGGSISGIPIVPDLISYGLLFKSVCCNLTEVMDTYRMFKCQNDSGSIIPDGSLFNNCVSAIVSKAVPDRTSLTIAFGIVNDMLSLGVAPTNHTCSLLVNLYMKCASAAQTGEEKDFYFGECEKLLTVTMEKEFDVVPELRLFVQAVTGAIMQRRMHWVNKLFSSMVDQHKKNKREAKLNRLKQRMLEETGSDEQFFLFTSSACETLSSDDEQTMCSEIITPETVNYLLKLSAKIDTSVDIFLMLVELVLLNKLGLRIEGVLKSLKPLSNKSREKLFGILRKYKYKISNSNLQ